MFLLPASSTHEKISFYFYFIFFWVGRGAGGVGYGLGGDLSIQSLLGTADNS